jgi:hypothetical protein
VAWSHPVMASCREELSLHVGTAVTEAGSWPGTNWSCPVAGLATGGLLGSGFPSPGLEQGPPPGLQSGTRLKDSPITPVPTPLSLIPGVVIEPSARLTKVAAAL